MVSTMATETRATGVVLLGCALAITSSDSVQLNFSNTLILWLGLIAVFLLTLIPDALEKSFFRQNAASGVLCCPLLPVCKLLSESSAGPDSMHNDVLQRIFLLGSFIVSLMLMCYLYVTWVLKQRTTDFVLGALSIITLAGASVLLFVKAWHSLAPVEFVVCLGLLLLQCFLHHFLPIWLPYSFTLGEAAVISQGCATFFLSAGKQYIYSWEHLLRTGALTLSLQATLFVQTAILSCLLVLILLFLIPIFRTTFGYYVLVPSVAATFSLPILLKFFGEDFVSWCFNYITSDRYKIYLFCYWFICCLVATSVVYFNASVVIEHSNSKEVLSSKHKGVISCHISTSIRKQFHFLASAILIPGLLLDLTILFMAASCALVVLVMLESMRVLRIAPVGETLHQYFQVFVDDRDEGAVILTHLYLLIGCSLPLWIHCHSDTHIALCSGLISLGIGDTVASITGSKFGLHPWPGTKKTVEGTVFAVLGQFISLILLSMTGVFVIPWAKCFTAVIFTSLLEAFTTQIDNLILPLFMYLLLI